MKNYRALYGNLRRALCPALAVAGMLAVSASANAQTDIWSNPITGTNPNTSNPYTTGDSVVSNLTVSGIGRGSGINGTSANDRYNANGWDTASIDTTAYFTFTLTPAASYEIDFTSFTYTGSASGTGPTSFAFRSSLDSFASNIGTPSGSGTTISLAGSSYQNITSAIEFRLYGWGASSSTGTFSVNSFTFNGSVSLNIPPVVWNGTGSGGTWENGQTGNFGSAYSNSLTNTVTFNGTAETVTTSGTVQAGNLVFNPAGYSVNGSLTLGAGSITTTTGTTTMNAAIAGTAGLAKSGAGTLVLAGSNSLSGNAVISAGNLTLAAAGALGSVGNVSVSSGTTLLLSGTAGNRISDSAGISVAGTFDVGGLDETVGVVNLTAGSIIGSGGTLTGSAYNVSNASGTTTISANLGGVTSALNKTGAGTLVLSGANTLGGGVTLSAGTLAINNASALGSGAFTIGGGTIDNTSGGAITLSTNNAQNWNASFTFTGTNDLNLGTGGVTLGSALTATVSGGNLTVGGNIGGAFVLTKAGAGTLVLNGNNTHTRTTITAGTVAVGHANALGASQVFFNGGTLRTAGSGDLVVNSDLSIGGDVTFGAGGNLTFGAASLFSTTRAVTVNNGSTTFASLGQSTTGLGITKNGAGNLIISGAKSNTGATLLNAGTFAVAGTFDSSGNINLAGGVLAMNGSLNKNLGTSAGQLRFTAGSTGFAGYGSNGTWGNSANNLTVNIGSNTTLTWNSTANFLANGQALRMGATIANGSATLTNPIALNGAARTVDVVRSAGAGLSNVDAFLTGNISGTGASSLVKTGAGVLQVSGVNSYAGGTDIQAGTLIAASSSALGSGDLTVEGGQLTLGTDVTGVGDFYFTGGSLSFGGYDLTLAAGKSVLWDGGTWLYSSGSTIFSSGSGTFDISGVTLSLSGLGRGSYVLASGFGGGGNAADFSFSGLGDGLTAMTSINDGILTLTVVPEPHEYAVAFAGLLVALVILRRRRLARQG